VLRNSAYWAFPPAIFIGIEWNEEVLNMASGTKTVRRKASRKAKLIKRDKRVKGLLRPIVRRKQLVRLKKQRKGRRA
jgi:hypothetical protein